MFKPEWNDEKNDEVYGKCSNPNWHGHNYTLFVTIKGNVDPDIGYVVNLKTLSKTIRKEVIDKIDHKNMNIEVAFMKNKVASSENLAIAIWEVLEKPINDMGIELHCVRIEETENNSVEYYGKD